MKNAIKLVVAVCALLLGWVSPVNAQEIVIGQYASLTGEIANFGKYTDLGVQLAVLERNAKGGIDGKKIVLKTYDSRGQQKDAKSAVTRLITQDKAIAIIGEVASSLSIAGGQVCQENGIPMVTPSSTNPDVTAIGDMIFRVCYTDDLQGLYAAKFAREKGWKTAAILYDRKQAYSVGLMDGFSDAFEDAGGKIVIDQAFSGGDTDFSAQLAAIKNAKPDVIFCPSYYNDLGNILRQAKNAGIAIPFLGGDGWTDVESVTPADVLNNCFYVNHWDPGDTSSDQSKTFLEKSKAKFPNDSFNVWSALGYDAANILFDAIDRADSTDGKKIAAELASVKDFKGVTGAITIDEKRNARKPAVILTFKDGKPSYVTSIKP
jgi:branched-chain amino acid transport system substrate-binding protein